MLGDAGSAPGPPPPGGRDDPEEPAIANAAIANDADGTPGAPAPPKIAAVIAAHPDDPDFGAGGTAALWTRQGWEFHYIVVTNGAKGSDDPTMTRDRLIAAREEEQRACAAVLGVSSCVFLGGEDGELDYSRAMLGKNRARDPPPQAPGRLHPQRSDHPSASRGRRRRRGGALRRPSSTIATTATPAPWPSTRSTPRRATT